jgi:hypothetical protein
MYDQIETKDKDVSVFVAPMKFNNGVLLSVNAICGSMSALLNQEQIQSLINSLEKMRKQDKVSA